MFNNRLGVNNINLEEDRLLYKFPVVIDISGNNDLSIHEVMILEALSPDDYSDIIVYYVLKPIHGKSVLNYNKRDFKKLNSKIPVKNYDIFQILEDSDQPILVTYEK